jgi:putative ABC transport system permease protein
MFWLRLIYTRLYGLLRKNRIEQEMEEELRFHLRMRTRENIERGMRPEEAEREAWRRFGNVGHIKDQARDIKGGGFMETLLQDLRYGVRTLVKHPGFTLIAVITLALGIGANTAIFSVVYALLLRPLPYHEPERLVMLGETWWGERRVVAYPNFSDWRERARSFEGMASFRWQSFNLTGVDKPVRLQGLIVNWNFFQLLGVRPQLGRMFAAEDDRYGAARTALLSNGMWKEKFAGEADVIGRKILLDSEPYEVIGVLPQGFEYFEANDLYVPIGLSLGPQSALLDRGNHMGLYAVARMKPGLTLEQADREMATLGTQLASEYPATNSGGSAQAEFLQDVMAEDVRQSLQMLFGAVGFILLIACVNVANLLLVRAADRRKEIALRLAIGAGRGRIIRQLLSESLLIALLGGAFGALLGRWMLSGLLALAPDNTPQLSRVSLDKTAMLFTLAVSALTSVLCGLAPALHAAGTDLQKALKEGGRSFAGASRDVTRKTLLVAEVGLALVLLVGAGLLARSMARLLSVDPGFNVENLLTMRIILSDNAYDKARAHIFYEECMARVSALPGVRSAALTHSLPINGTFWNSVFIVGDKPVPPRAELPSAGWEPVTPNYFETMGIRLLRGRLFNAAEPNASNVTVINERLAQRLWPGEDPIGKRLKQGWPEDRTPWREVIGVVADIKMNGVQSGTPMQAYLPITQEHNYVYLNFHLVVRTAGDPLLGTAAVEHAIHSIDKDLPISGIRSMEQLLGVSLAQQRLTLLLLASIAALALALAAIGIYGVISYWVRQRTHELSIRMALGAQARDVLKLILAQGLKLALIGVVIGLAAAFALTRWMESLLFGVRPTDPLTFAMVAVTLLCVALLACYFPARRATKVDPLVALRRD